MWTGWKYVEVPIDRLIDWLIECCIARLFDDWSIDWLIDRLIGVQSDLSAGQSKLVLRPKTTQQVSDILRHCNDRKLAVCPQGGNTGLVGGSVPVFDEVVLSMGLMNKIISLDPMSGKIQHDKFLSDSKSIFMIKKKHFSGVLITEAGAVLETLENHAADHGRVVPIDLGAKGSCHIGGWFFQHNFFRILYWK